MKKPSLKRLRVFFDNTRNMQLFTLDSEEFKLVNWNDYGQEAAYKASLNSIAWEFENGVYAFSEKAAHYAKVHKINPDKLFVAWDQYIRSL